MKMESLFVVSGDLVGVAVHHYFTSGGIGQCVCRGGKGVVKRRHCGSGYTSGSSFKLFGNKNCCSDKIK